MNKVNEICPYGEKFQPYWDLRYDFFSKFDEGIKIDKEGLYSVKPEKSAFEIAKHMVGDVVVDAFGGVGGSAIAFAMTGKKVISIELNQKRSEYARNNAQVYGVYDQIEFINGDCLEVIPKLKFDSIYFDPPWGGINYYKTSAFKMNGFSPNGMKLIEIAKKNNSFLGFTVPNNFDYNEVSSLAKDFYVHFDFLEEKKLYSTFYIDFGEKN